MTCQVCKKKILFGNAEKIKKLSICNIRFGKCYKEKELDGKVPLVCCCKIVIASVRYLWRVMGVTLTGILCCTQALKGECGFMAANLFAKSIFGESVLANLSVESNAAGPVTGHIRIRAKSQVHIPQQAINHTPKMLKSTSVFSCQFSQKAIKRKLLVSRHFLPLNPWPSVAFFKHFFIDFWLKISIDCVSC